MNRTLHAQSIHQELLRSHARVCPLRVADTSMLKTQLSDIELTDTKGKFSFLIDVWKSQVSIVTQNSQGLDGFFLLCTNDGYIVDIEDSKSQSNLIHSDGVSSGANFFRMISKWEKSEWMGQADVCVSDICAHPIMHDFCSTMPLYAILSPFLSHDTQNFGATFVYVTPYITALTMPLIRSIAMGIAHTISYEMTQRQNQFVKDALLQHLDCHMIFLDENNEVTNEVHPIKLDVSEVKQMYQITSQVGCQASKQAIGNRVYHVNVSRFNHDDDSHSHLTLGLFKDITRQEQYVDRLRDLEKCSSLVTLSAGIAHEIRNPLTTARGFLQLFLKRSDSPTDKQFLELTITELDRIQTLLRDFMNIAKPDIKNRQSIDLIALVHEVIHFMRPEASLKNVELRCETCTESAWIEADAGQMKQVFMNILQNAVQACEKRGHVTISIFLDDKQVHIHFTDTGCGISDITQLFHPFYTTKEAGTGLGLVVSKHIVEEHRGKIEIESIDGCGTTVIITLPLIHSKP